MPRKELSMSPVDMKRIKTFSGSDGLRFGAGGVLFGVDTGCTSSSSGLAA